MIRMINWSFVVCFVGMIFYLCFCIYYLIDVAAYSYNKVYSFRYRVVLLIMNLFLMCFGVYLLFSLIERFLL